MYASTSSCFSACIHPIFRRINSEKTTRNIVTLAKISEMHMILWRRVKRESFHAQHGFSSCRLQIAGGQRQWNIAPNRLQPDYLLMVSKWKHWQAQLMDAVVHAYGCGRALSLGNLSISACASINKLLRDRVGFYSATEFQQQHLTY